MFGRLFENFLLNITTTLLEYRRINLQFYKFIRISINELLIILNLRSKNKTTKIVIFLDYPIKDLIDFIFEKSFDL